MDIRDTLMIIPGIILGFSLHEYAHGQMAVWLGDDTPRLQGRLTLNPLVHIDIMGFIFILLAGFGWAKPVEVNENNFRNKRRDHILVALAGPLVNLAIALIFFAAMKAFYYVPSNIMSETLYYTIMDVFDYTAWINVVLFVFNLLPIPPLDGSHVFFGLLGLKEKNFYHQLYSKGSIILMILIITNVIDKIIIPPIEIVYNGLGGLFF